MEKTKKKTKLLTMKTTEKEMAEWRKLAASHGVSLSELIRIRLADTQPATNPPPIHRPPPQVDDRIIFQIAAIGNNLNQIARRCNSGDRLDVLTELSAIERDLAKMVEMAKSGELTPCT